MFMFTLFPAPLLYRKKKNNTPMSTVTHKEEVKKRLAKIIKDKQDGSGNKIVTIFNISNEYIIYQIDSVDISSSFKVRVDPYDEEDPHNIEENFDNIRVKLDEFRSVLHKANNPINAMQRASSAIASSIRGKHNDAKEAFERIIKEIKEEYKEKIMHRFVYLLGYLSIVFLLSSFSMHIYLSRNQCYILNNYDLFNLFIMGTFGTWGGFLSISLKLKEISFEREISAPYVFSHSLNRAFYAFLLGICGYMLLYSGLIFSWIKPIDTNHYAMILGAIISGFSEKFIPNQLSRLENK